MDTLTNRSLAFFRSIDRPLAVNRKRDQPHFASLKRQQQPFHNPVDDRVGQPEFLVHRQVSTMDTSLLLSSPINHFPRSIQILAISR